MPARKHPDTYPGGRPAGSYLLLDDFVCPLLADGPAGLHVVTPDGEGEDLDALLERAGLPVLDDRVAVLAYGANRNPATLAIKFANYGYTCPGSRVALPMLRAAIGGADAAACNLSGQGYLYGDLLLEPTFVGETRCEAWLALVDPDQLRVLHESEIGTHEYVGVRFPGTELDGPSGPRVLRGPVLGYAARRPCFVSPQLGAPLAFETIDADRRSLPEMTPLQMLDHVLDVSGMREPVASIAGSRSDGELARAVAYYLNRNWWRVFAGGEPQSGYGRLISMLQSGIAARSLERSTASIMAERGLALTEEEAYHPDATLTWGRL